MRYYMASPALIGLANVTGRQPGSETPGSYIGRRGQWRMQLNAGEQLSGAVQGRPLVVVTVIAVAGHILLLKNLAGAASKRAF